MQVQILPRSILKTYGEFMGDMADFYNEQVFEAEDARFEYRQGRMGDVEAYENGIIDERGFEITSGVGPIKTCRCCGKSGLLWTQSENGKWRLRDGRGIHVCSVNPLKENK